MHYSSIMPRMEHLLRYEKDGLQKVTGYLIVLELLQKFCSIKQSECQVTMPEEVVQSR